MNTVVVLAEIESLDSSSGQVANRLLTDESEHAAMMILVDVEIEDVVATGGHQVVEHSSVPSFADVRHAFEHLVTLPGGGRQL